jgi:nicotinamide mononucleotide transporter
MNILFDWITRNWIELFGTASAILYLYFSIKQNIWLWPLGILTSAIFVFIFFQSKFYADAGLNVYYVMISIYGWYFWIKGKESSTKKELPISRIRSKQIIFLSAISLLLIILISWILIHFTDSPVPIGDAFTTGLSIVATWMLARKILEHWLVWIVVDAVSLGLYIYKDLYITSVLFLIYTGMAYYGYREWKNSRKSIVNE